MRNYIVIFIVCAFIACSPKKEEHNVIVIKNILNIDRSFETVELTKELLGIDDKKILEQYGIREVETKEFLITQTIDEDGDGISDVLLFQPKILKLSKKRFEIVLKETVSEKDTAMHCYSRFVPERTDDYAWENNRVAFRTFGPMAQKMIEEGIPGGTLASGIDAWLKKVEYPIINKWYKKTITETGSYHEDTGEGLDNFHVGASRGVGGIAIKVDSTYVFSKNFVSWKTISNGPIRTSFKLEYANWSVDGAIIKESKNISLDFGSNVSRYEVFIEGKDQISAGLTLHENDGVVTANDTSGYISYWQPHGDSELGTAIIVPQEYYIGHEKYETTKADLSNLYAHLKATKNKVVYYAGFGWKESGQFETSTAWENYVQQFSEKINNPLIVQIR